MEQHDLLLTSFLAPEQGSPQSQDLHAAQKIWQMTHGCKYVGPKVQKKTIIDDIISQWTLQVITIAIKTEFLVKRIH
jgi:hypothetical protein